MEMTPAPILVGSLFDFPQADEGAGFLEAVRLGLADVAASGRLDRTVELVPHLARGLPLGTARDVEDGFDDLDALGVLAILGPSISDNGLIARDLADERELPCINYTGGEHTRSEFMFHYQVGSLEEEPAVLARHLVDRGLGAVAVVHDHSPVGRRYAEFFDQARGLLDLAVTGTAAISPLAQDAGTLVRRLRVADPDALLYLGLGVSARTVALALRSEGWDLPVVANSALMFGYGRRDWREAWEGWVYVDTVADDNEMRARLRERSRPSAAGPIGVAAYDMGRLLGEGLARSVHLTREGLRDGLERVKQLPATSGRAGTMMGFGSWDHGALKGPYLVLRAWREGHTVQVG
jgi:ABC-type branched-subunit amino acid transport system substrate-binding protein